MPQGDSRHLTCIISLDPLTDPLTQVQLLSPFYRQEQRSTEFTWKEYPADGSPPSDPWHHRVVFVPVGSLWAFLFLGPSWVDYFATGDYLARLHVDLSKLQDQALPVRKLTQRLSDFPRPMVAGPFFESSSVWLQSLALARTLKLPGPCRAKVFAQNMLFELILPELKQNGYIHHN